MPDLQVLSISQGRLQARPDLVIFYDGSGKMYDGPGFFSGSDVAVQDVIRGLLTLIGTSPLAPNFGTSLSELLSTRSVGQVSGAISQQVQNVLGYLAQMASNSDPAERVVEVIDMKVKQNGQTIEVTMSLRTGLGQTVTVTVS
jgi:hypothetical protein